MTNAERAQREGHLSMALPNILPSARPPVPGRYSARTHTTTPAGRATLNPTRTTRSETRP